MQKHFKRLVMVVVMSLLVMTIGAAVSAQEEPTQLRFIGWGGPEERAVFEELVATFNENNPDIVITYEQISADYVTALQTQVAGGTAPDIAYVPDGNFASFAPLGALVNLQSLVDESEVINEDEIWASALNRYRWNGEQLGVGDLYALPKDIGPTVLYINEDLFEEAGVELPDPETPLTWEELVEIGTQLTRDTEGRRPGDEGFDPNSVDVFGIGELWVENIFYGNGAQIVSDDARTFLLPNDPRAVEAIQFQRDLIHEYGIAPTAAQTSSQSVSQLFEAGKVAITTNGRWAVTGYRNNLSFNWDVRPNPVGPSGEVYAAGEDCAFSGWSGSVGLAIFAGTQGEANADKAFRFLEFVAGAEGQTAQAALGFQIPNQIELAESDVFLQPDQEPQNAQVFLEAARCEFAGPWTVTPYWGQWFDPFFWRGAWQAAVVDNVESVEDAFASRAEQAQSDLDDAWETFEDSIVQ